MGQKSIYKNKVEDWLFALLHLFFPRTCVVCHTPLIEGEECICTRCNLELPRTQYHLRKENPVEHLFWGKFPLERATAYFFYQKGSDYRKVLHQLKYNGRKEVGAVMGRYLAAELQPDGFFQGIDVLIPVPLHPSKQKARGYNQSEWLAKGISQVTGIPLDTDSVLREKSTETQTRKSVYERWENVEGIFRLRHPNNLAGKHVLIVDDVLTTGSTLTACADAVCATKGVCISVLALAMAEG